MLCPRGGAQEHAFVLGSDFRTIHGGQKVEFGATACLEARQHECIRLRNIEYPGGAGLLQLNMKPSIEVIWLYRA